MKRLLLALVAVGLIVWFFWAPRNTGNTPVASTPSPASTAPAQPARRIAGEDGSSKAPPAPVEVSHLADQLNAPGGNIRADLKIVADVLENFRTNFPHDGNPVGNNAEITAALTGQNRLRYAAIPPNHPAINRDGELCDRWGTPFFFHAESGTRMGIRSAGPDKKMWTADDVMLEP